MHSMGLGRAGSAWRSVSGPVARVVAVCLVLIGYAGWLWRLPVVHQGPPGEVPWWGVALLCLGCELVVLNIRLQRQAQGISLGELSIVIGLFLAGPGPFVLGRLVGATT